MKYMTKEWYETMQKTDLHLLLRCSKDADIFSEKTFKKLYKREERKFLKSREKMYDSSVIDELSNVFSDEPVLTTPEGETVEPTDEDKEFLQALKGNIFDRLDESPSFDPEHFKNVFRRGYKNSLKQYRSYLPDDILNKIVDIRVLALGYASKEEKKEITRFCRQNNKAVDSAVAEYEKTFEKEFRKNRPSFVDELDLHDSTVGSCRKRGNDIVITLDNCCYSNISKIRFKNCTVIKQDAPLRGAWFLYDETYKNGGRYELHFLLEKTTRDPVSFNLIDYIVSADDVEIYYSAGNEDNQ